MRSPNERLQIISCLAGANFVSAFVKTSPFALNEPYYGNSASLKLLTPTQDSRFDKGGDEPAVLMLTAQLFCCPRGIAADRLAHIPLNEPYYGNSASLKLLTPTQDSRDIIAAATNCLDATFSWSSTCISLALFCRGASSSNRFSWATPWL
jgi:nucleotidyltransferase/DNA polymerase involved in DNA repair